MSIFALDIGARRAAAIEAFDMTHARGLLLGETFKAYLRTRLGRTGAPVWDGVEALSVREASDDETAGYRGLRTTVGELTDGRRWTMFVDSLAEPE